MVMVCGLPMPPLFEKNPFIRVPLPGLAAGAVPAIVHCSETVQATFAVWVLSLLFTAIDPVRPLRLFQLTALTTPAESAAPIVVLAEDAPKLTPMVEAA